MTRIGLFTRTSSILHIVILKPLLFNILTLEISTSYVKHPLKRRTLKKWWGRLEKNFSKC
jgi:hypothetical protein